MRPRLIAMDVMKGALLGLVWGLVFYGPGRAQAMPMTASAQSGQAAVSEQTTQMAGRGSTTPREALPTLTHWLQVSVGEARFNQASGLSESTALFQFGYCPQLQLFSFLAASLEAHAGGYYGYWMGEAQVNGLMGHDLGVLRPELLVGAGLQSHTTRRPRS